MHVLLLVQIGMLLVNVCVYDTCCSKSLLCWTILFTLAEFYETVSCGSETEFRFINVFLQTCTANSCWINIEGDINMNIHNKSAWLHNLGHCKLNRV